MASMASSVVVLCDSSKIGRDSFAQFAPLDQIDTLITDSCREVDRTQLEEHGIAVIC
jgi:DeoR family fructose operon transcriptional repressor